MEYKNKSSRWRKSASLITLVMLLVQMVSTPIAVLADTSKVTELKKVTEETVDENSLAVDGEGVVYYQGQPLYAGKGDELVPAKLQDLMKEGVKQELVLEEDISSIGKIIDTIIGFILPKTVKASDSVPHITYNGSISFGRTRVGDFQIDGVQAFCIEHSKSSPPTGTPFNSLNPYQNSQLQRALYYGWNGPGNIFSNRAQGIVVTSSVLSRIYSGEINGSNNDGYDELWNLVQNGQVPFSGISLSDSNLSVSVNGNKQVSQSTTLNADSTNTVTFTVPSGITVINESTGAIINGGSVTIQGGQTFHLEAPLTYGSTYNSGILKGTMQVWQPMITIPKSSGYQTLATARWYTDPTQTVSFSAPFVVREKKITVQHIDRHTNALLATESYTKTIGSSYQYTPRNSIVQGSNTFLLENMNSQSGVLGSSDITLNFYYNLQRTITINHKDARDGSLITTESYKKLRGESYSYGPRNDLKKGTYTYRPTSTAIKSGTVGADNITIDFFYDVPLIKTGLEKIQVFTAPAVQGLPVKVNLSKVNIYPETVADMANADIHVSLYQGTAKIASNAYTAKTLPTSIDFKVPPNVLAVNQKKEYTVKLESFTSDEVDVITNAASITADGYTSSQSSFNITNTALSYTGVIKTERVVGQNMVVYNENLQINLRKIEKKRTGYGFEYPVDVIYQNDLGQKLSSDFDLYVPSKLIPSYLTYPVTNNLSRLNLDETDNKESTNRNVLTTTKRFELPKTNVEDRTGYLFSDSQVAAKDSRIKYTTINGGRKLYTPIWGDLGTYPLEMKNVAPLGVHQINISMKQNLEIYASMYGHMDSPTGKQDGIYLTPVNADGPNFPESWTEEDKKIYFEWNEESKKNHQKGTILNSKINTAYEFIFR